MTCWIRLGIEPTKDHDVIRVAYRARLPEHHPETDPQGFQALRQAYEAALQYARQAEAAANKASEDEGMGDDSPLIDPQPDEVSPVLADFNGLLDDETRRFDPAAWQGFIQQLDQLPLESLEQVSWQVLHTLIDCGPLSYACARLLERRLGWSSQLLQLDLGHAQQIDQFLQRIERDDPFDTAQMSQWSPAAQVETLWYTRTLEQVYQQRPLHEFVAFFSQHTCLPLPREEAFVQRLLVQCSLAGIGGPSLLELCQERHRQAPDDADALYLLACQASALGLTHQALQHWSRLWQQHQHPQAATWLLGLCAERQPLWQPLLIQAFDRLENFRAWPHGLGDVEQAFGSPSQRPETLARWYGLNNHRLKGLAGAFVDWRLGADEWPLLAQLCIDQTDSSLQRLYRHAWALHRGDVALLQALLAEPDSTDVLEQLVLEGFKYQAEQLLCWLTQAPVPLALKAFLESHSAHAYLAHELNQGEPRALCQLWLKRWRPYESRALERIAEVFEPARQGAEGSELELWIDLGRQGVYLPAMPSAQDAWSWHRQTLFLTGLLQQPERWLELTGLDSLACLTVTASHPLARLLSVLQRLPAEQSGLFGLLGWLDSKDPVQSLLAQRLMSAQQALDSPRLPSNLALYTCYLSDDQPFNDEALGTLLFWGVLYQDPLLDAEQHRALLKDIARVTSDGDWFEAFRDGLIKGQPSRPPLTALEADGIDSSAFSLAVNTLKGLVRYGSAGVPRRKLLQKLQRAKDDTAHSIGLRFALTALLSWCERLLLAKADTQPASPLAMWRLGTRLAQGPFFWQVLGCGLLTPWAALMCGSVPLGLAILLLGALALFGVFLRRLHDMGRGLPTLLICLLLTPALPFLPLLMLVAPSDRLPNRYGVPPSGDRSALQGGLQAGLRRLNG
jgi:hypothetical protein